ncbi:IPT/TIG domain-containing protein [Wukongibacter sp. M2B1]|uniref:IPT/TIG domain-containing protein n=1 Tax=Wukongibacter sp. M2B1 TaxID=3088895 RepID=UPI003D7AAB7E
MKKKKSKSFISRTVALLIAILMVLSTVGWEDMISHAFDPSDFKVDSVTIYKIYNRNRNLETRRILIMGSNIQDAPVGVIGGAGYTPLNNRTVNTSGVIQFDLTDDQLGNSIVIDSITIPLNEGDMPTLSGVTRQVQRDADAADGGEIVLQGSNLEKIDTDIDPLNPGSDITAKYEYLGAENFLDNRALVDGKYKKDHLTGDLGLKNIIMEKTQVAEDIDFPNNPDIDVTVTITYNYQEQFRLVEGIGNVHDLKMFPNRGISGDKVYFTGQNLDSYDVFFLTEINGTDPYTNSNKGQNKTFLPDSGETPGEDVLTVEVPNIAVGEYYVVLTNAVADDKDPMEEVNQIYVVQVDNANPDTSDDDKFYIIDGSSKPTILNIQPNSGPDSGQAVTISGEFLGTLNIPEFHADDPDIKDVTYPGADEEVLEINYSTGTYNGDNVTSAKRTISITIGDKAKFSHNADDTDYVYSFTSDLDTIGVITPVINDAEDDPMKDVVAEIKTVFTTAGGDIVIKERVELTDGYTYIPSKLTPIIDEVVPEKIQVQNNGADYELQEDLLVGIYGENFAIHKYIDGGNEKLMYPQIELGEIVLNKSFGAGADPNVDIKLFNDSGELLDGTEGNEIGTKILVTIPAGTTISTIGKTFVKITNPVRNSENPGLNYKLNNGIEFVEPASNKIPVINEVNPNIVTVDGGEEITIEGSNFQDGVMVFIDGAKVEPINRSEDGREITFTSPPGREGETQLLVMNEEGGMDTYSFTYVKTYTNPIINDFSPKKGNTGTLVVVDGDNFLKPDPTGDEENIFKLIGTRVYLEGEDINRYNLNPSTKKVILEDYKAPDGSKIFSVSGGKLVLGDYYHSIVLNKQPENTFYTIEVDATKTPYITNGVDETYKIKLVGSDIKAEKEGGATFDLNVDGTTDPTADLVELDDGAGTTITLRIKTPFQRDASNVIIGDHVKVIDKNTIYFTVPILNTEGYYDLSVVNPDTKKDTKANEQGFYYFKQPQSQPKITNVDPDQGSNAGGYTITITGTEFMDNGDSKTKIIIGGVEIGEDDTTVSVDGTEIVVKVPPYAGDLDDDLDTDRITVPVVVLNPDGGSDSLEDGFTYVIPASNPEIVKIVPESGSAAGGDIIEITGFDFRFFEPFDDLDRDQAHDADEPYHDINGDGVWNNEAQIGTANDWTDPIAFEHEIYDKYYSSPILPKVYFGDKTAKIVEFSTGYLKVILPTGSAGAVDVYVINNDSGISNKVDFNYNDSNPTISSVVPNEGKKQGMDKIEIKGQDFEKSSIKVYTYDSSNDIIKETKSIVLVNFGRITNKDIGRTEENSGLINNGRTTVNLEGNLRIEYDGINNTLKPFIEEDDIVYQISGGITGYNDEEVYIPVSMLKNSNGSSYSGYELIRVWVEDNRLFVERGFAPEVEYVSSEHIIVNTPSYHTVDTVPLIVINPDGGEAETEFTYKNPDSSPKITNITKEGREPVEKDGKKVLEVTYKGGNIVSVYGEDFREEAIIKISDILTIDEGDITYQLPNRLTFTMPEVPEEEIGKLHRVVVQNKDGGIASSDETVPMAIYIQFIKGETIPQIGSITPDKGPSSGGTKVTIEGEDFREIMNDNRITVYFGSAKVPDEDVEVINYKTIEVYTPAHSPGKVEVKVENPDGELSAPVGEFTYISTPNIVSVVNPATDKKIYTISIEGGDKIRIKGSGFNDGAKVVVNPVLKEVDYDEDASDNLVYIGSNIYELKEGDIISQVEYIDSETLDFTTPSGKLGAITLMVINEDDGGSNIYKGIEYGLPDISPPGNVVATLMYDKYIKIEWDEVKGAAEYELFVVIDDGGAEYIGATDLTSMVYEDLDTRTEYMFLVKSVGEYGASLGYGESNIVETGRDIEEPDDDDGEIDENTGTIRTGDKVELSLGTSDYDDEDIELDLTKTEFAGTKKVTVNMPGSVIASDDARNITIIGGSFRIKFNPRIFYNSTIKEKESEEDLGVRFTVNFSSKDADSSSSGSLSQPLILEGKLFDGKEYRSIEYLKSKLQITLDFDEKKAQMRRYKEIELYRYDEYEDEWTPIASRVHDYATTITTMVDMMGKYSIMGKREGLE